MVDAGAVELVGSSGPRVVSSADLVQKYEACWSAEQLESHLSAGVAIDRIVREAFQLAAKSVREKKTLTEFDLKNWILKEFDAAGMWTGEGPDRAGNAHASDAYHRPTAGAPATVSEGGLLLLEGCGKKEKPRSVFYDGTAVGR